MTRRLRVLMVVENNGFPQDVRVRQEAAALVAVGHEVTVIAPGQDQQPPRETVNGVSVLRYKAPPEAEGITGYAVEYGLAAWHTFRLSLLRLFKGGFDVVHVHNPPDALVMMCALYRLAGKRLVFDHHDAAPEMYQVLFGGGPPILLRALRFTERMACRLAHRVIATNASLRDRNIAVNGVRPENAVIVRNGPDLDLLTSSEATTPSTADGKQVICYVGNMGQHDGVHQLLRAVRLLLDDRGPDRFVCRLVGSGSAVGELKQLADELDLGDAVEFVGRVHFAEVGGHLRIADVCVAPEPSDSYNDLCTVIKLMEYMAVAKPVVAFDLPEHRVTAGPAALFAEPNDVGDLAAKIGRVLSDPALAAELGHLGHDRVVTELAWPHQAEHLVSLYDELSELVPLRKSPAPVARLRKGMAAR